MLNGSENASSILPIKDRFKRQFLFRADPDCLLDGMTDAISPIVRSVIDGRTVEGVNLVAEGSYNQVFSFGDFVGRFTPAKLGERFLERVRRSILCARGAGFFDVLVSGTIYREDTGLLIGRIMFMERMHPVPVGFSDESMVWEMVWYISRFGFHNDFKFDNILMAAQGRIRAVDYDYLDANKLVISLSAFQCIEFDLSGFLGELDVENIRLFRSFYDYTYLSASLNAGNPLYSRVIARLANMFNSLERNQVLSKLVAFVAPEKLKDIPFEVLVRCPDVDAVSVHLLDLRGNAFAHRLSTWESFPTLIKSNGVYWPDR